MYGQIAARRALVPSGAGSAGLGSLFLACCLPLVLAVTVEAQEAAPEVELRYARITADEAPLYCWPSQVASPPHYEDTLTKGQVVQVGRVEGTFIQVVLPLGPVGYVSKRYSSTSDDGKVTTKTGGVSFRYRPMTAEAPVMQLEDGVELFVLSEQDDWWRVRLPAAEAWLPQAQVQIGDSTDPQLLAAWGETRARFQQEVDSRLEAIAAEKARTAQTEADLAAVQLVEEAFGKELQKVASEQQFAPLTKTLDKLEESLAEDSTARAPVASLRRRIETQQWIAEATVVRNRKPVPSNEELPPPQPKDQLERFGAIGWLRYEGRLGAPGIYYLEKGGLRLHHVTCNTGRYDLSMFRNCEIGIMGPRRSPSSASFSEIDAERIEVLGHNRK